MHSCTSALFDPWNLKFNELGIPPKFYYFIHRLQKKNDMPELPEIALYKKYVDSTALHQKIGKVEFIEDSLLQHPKKDIGKELKGNELTSTYRRGKYLFIELKSGKWLVLHFGMTGELKYYQNQDTPDYTKMLLHFENDYKLAYIFPRKLGKIYLAEDKDNFCEDHEIGRDALDFSQDQFKKYLENKRGSLKGALTDQQSISGIGNVYADEIAFQCRMHPKSDVSMLSAEDIANLYQQTNEVLKTVIEKDAERSEFPDNYLTPHRKDGTDCPTCNGEVKQIKISGRSTYFCPKCQKKK
ncbi:MAG: DNA-formamidopyrimidine glycosylase family protein [Brumimicrobium sp.]|nr:DNA-formamidopyrimidine glycosylase family protein [Brumimicrobium sp.]